MEERQSTESALASIEAIRDVLDRTTRYTHVSALGLILAGSTAAGAAAVGWTLDADPLIRPAAFLGVWTTAFFLALLLGVVTTARKARRVGEPLWNRKLRFVLGRFLPAFVVGTVVTTVLADVGRLDLAPGLWLGIYGLGILSVSVVLDWEYQLTGWAFLLASAAALFLLRPQPQLAQLVGFGVLHVALGSYRLTKEAAWQRLPRSLGSKS